MIEVGKSGALRFKSWPVDELAREFSDTHCAVLRHVLPPELELPIRSKIRDSHYGEKVDTSRNGTIIAKEYALPSDNLAHRLLYFVLNTKEFIDTVKTITGISAIQSLSGRVYKFEPGAETFDNWHSDLGSAQGPERLLGFSLNLGTEPYDGGNFRLRAKEEPQIIRDIHYGDWGSAHLFRIRRDLVHMVSAVEGDVPRVVYAGWFFATEPFVRAGPATAR